jgi:hypothetical protein
MTRLKTLVAALFLSSLACLPAFAQAPGTASQPDMPMTAASRQQLVDRLAEEVGRRYVFPDVAKQVAATLRARQARGAYAGMDSARQLAEALTQEMQAVSKDRHLRVLYSEEPIPARKPEIAPSAEEAARYLAMLRSGNFGVEKIERLPLNIGYLELNGFAPVKEAADTLAAAMTVLAHTDALIVDLRNNGGGDGSTSLLLASYLFDERTHLNDFYYRDGNRIEQRWSLDVVPGLRYGQRKDVYILTSKDSFSAAEDFSYALKNLKRASVVGETTGGGANGGDDVRLLPNFSAFIPLSRMVSPITKTNWEGVGVSPDIAVCAGDALRTAQLAVLKKWAARETRRDRLDQLEGRIAELGAGHAAGARCP